MTDIRRSVPSDVMDALKQPPPPIQEDDIVYIRHATTGACLYARSKLGVYNKVKLDTSIAQAEIASVTRVAEAAAQAPSPRHQ